MITPPSDAIIKHTQAVLAEEGLQTSSGEPRNNLAEILPALKTAKDIQAPLFNYDPLQGNIVRRGKNLFVSKMRNIIINTIEKTIMRQQKYNELTYKAILELKQEIDELKARNHE